MVDEVPRSRAAREAAESALIRVVKCYGSTPEFVLLGGLVPELLCANSTFQHAGTTDVDVQVDLEIACGAVNAARLEQALRDADFEPDGQCVWRWTSPGHLPRTVVKFELLADLPDEPAESTVQFGGCNQLGAANLRGTGFAARDVQTRLIKSTSEKVEAHVNVTTLAGYLLAKCAAARSRRNPKDWYDIAFVLLNNDAGGPSQAATAIRETFGSELAAVRTALSDLRANFAAPRDQGTRAYVRQMILDYPELDEAAIAADAVVAVDIFVRHLIQ